MTHHGLLFPCPVKSWAPSLVRWVVTLCDWPCACLWCCVSARHRHATLSQGLMSFQNSPVRAISMMKLKLAAQCFAQKHSWCDLGPTYLSSLSSLFLTPQWGSYGGVLLWVGHSGRELEDIFRMFPLTFPGFACPFSLGIAVVCGPWGCCAPV